MLFASASLARRIEEAEASLVRAFAMGIRQGGRVPGVFIADVSGGVAAIAGEHSPFNKLLGLGFQPLDEAALEPIEQEFARRGIRLHAEVATLADPAVAAALTRRGYVLSGFENVLGLPLESGPPPFVGASDLEIQRVAPEQSREWTTAVATAFLAPDTYDGPASHDSFGQEALEQVFEETADVPGFERYLVVREGTVAGGGSMRIYNGVAQLCGAATLPAHRRRGIQSSLLRHRLAEAAAAGCDIAVVTTSPGSKSQENVQKLGFQLLYSRAILLKV
jgi:ribosomal protein S18 acetylase RimI-like enzyme